MRISDWSSDVCSSDLIVHAPAVHGGPGQAARGGDRWSPWAAVNGWRMNDAGADDLHFRDRDTDLHCRVEYLADGSVRLFGLESTVVAGGTLEPDGSLAAVLDGRRLRAGKIGRASCREEVVPAW